VNVLIKLVAALALLAVVVFCIFGFLATFESPSFLGWRIFYSAIGISSLVAAVQLLARYRGKPADGNG